MILRVNLRQKNLAKSVVVWPKANAWNTEPRHSYFCWLICFPYSSWKSPPKHERIFFRSAAFLYNVKMTITNRKQKFTLVVAVSCTHFPQPLLRNKHKLRLYLNSWLIWQYEFGNTIKASANFQRLRLVKIIYTTKRSKNVEVQCIKLWPYCKGIVMRRIPSLIEAIQRLSYFIHKEDFQWLYSFSLPWDAYLF